MATKLARFDYAWDGGWKEPAEDGLLCDADDAQRIVDRLEGDAEHLREALRMLGWRLATPDEHLADPSLPVPALACVNCGEIPLDIGGRYDSHGPHCSYPSDSKMASDAATSSRG